VLVSTPSPFYARIEIFEATTTITNKVTCIMIGRLVPPKIKKRDYTPYDGPQRRPGRPRKNFPTPPDASTQTPSNSSSNQVPHSITVPRKKRTKKKKSQKLSLLESLPVELLQNIFLESLNVTLPCISLALATNLSSGHLQLEMSMRMLITRRRTIGQKERSKLLACRFFTYDFLIKFAHQAHNYFIGLPVAVEIIMQGAGSLQQYDNPNLFTYHPSFPRTMTLMEVEDNRWCPQGLSKLFIPLKLLRAPWTLNRVWFLQGLVQEDCQIDPNSTGLEAAFAAVLDIIREGDQDGILSVFLDRNYSEGLLPVTHNMFRCAVLEGGCKRDVIHTLTYPHNNVENMEMGERTSSLNFLDPDLWAWVERQRENVDKEEADWLQQVLETEGRCIAETIDSNY
jgi:hypothetical protein